MTKIVNPQHRGLIVRVVRGIRNVVLKSNNILSQDDPTRKNKSTDLQDIMISGFNQPTEEIRNIFSGGEKFPFIDLYVHGSWADNTRTAFSDLDDLVIVNREKIDNNKQIRQLEIWLNRVDMKFCRIDPLQHHGHWLIYRDDLDYCNEAYIPLTVLEGAICVQGSKSITAKINHELTHAGIRRNLNFTIMNIERLYDKYKDGSINLYEMKGLIGSFLLVPAYAFQSKKKRSTKKWALDNSDQIYSEQGKLAIEWGTFMRNNWYRALDRRAYFLLSLVPYFFTNPHLYRRFARQISPKFPKKEFPHFDESWVRDFIQDTMNYVNG